jgi:hypothetical protein
MSVSGLCDICERPDVDHGCDRCGRLVCDRHWDDRRGVCVDCRADVGGGSQRDPAPEDLPDGVDTYEF